ncbi:response regulator [Sphingosinicella sp. BN140058]|uniref:response regulator n=1 Tax=Sphingosinicella sp. BN140058 TaxID=1892855 RepID=UPI0013E9F2A6|nr:response regulator [Sphingosinicella sp. BN140058]
MLKLIIVEDERQLALTLQQLVELNPRYKVAAMADDLASALAAAEAHRPDLALVDLQLANSCSGFNVASKLHDLGVLCLFITGTVPSFPLPDLAIGCLAKPFREDDLVRALAEAEDVVRGREKLVLRETLPPQLQLYTRKPARRPQPDWSPPAPPRLSWHARLIGLFRRPDLSGGANAR